MSPRERFKKASEADDDLIEWLRDQTWSDFAQSLVDYFERNGRLTIGQIQAAESMREKSEERRRSWE